MAETPTRYPPARHPSSGVAVHRWFECACRCHDTGEAEGMDEKQRCLVCGHRPASVHEYGCEAEYSGPTPCSSCRRATDVRRRS